jgi:dipeptidyl aminopeptidase/acylaminoacyl peptidase
MVTETRHREDFSRIPLPVAVALQTAAIDPRVRAVAAASTFSDLRTIATERARAMMLPAWSLGPAFARVERDGHFAVDDVSPVKAAATIAVPVLLLHGADDRDTPPAHSRRVFAALHEPKQLIIVPGARHNDILGPRVWEQIARWVESSLPE